MHTIAVVKLGINK